MVDGFDYGQSSKKLRKKYGKDVNNKSLKGINADHNGPYNKSVGKARAKEIFEKVASSVGERNKRLPEIFSKKSSGVDDPTTMNVGTSGKGPKPMYDDPTTMNKGSESGSGPSPMKPIGFKPSERDLMHASDFGAVSLTPKPATVKVSKKQKEHSDFLIDPHNELGEAEKSYKKP